MTTTHSKLILITILAFFITSCNNNKQTSKEEFIHQLIKEHTLLPYTGTTEYNTTAINNLSQGNTIVYFMDASCSVCIYKLIEFYKQAELSCDSKIYVITDEDYLPQVEYNLSKANIHLNKERLEILCNTQNSYLNGNIEDTDLNGRIIYGSNKQATYIGTLDYIVNK